MTNAVTPIKRNASLSQSVRDLVAEGGYSLASDDLLLYGQPDMDVAAARLRPIATPFLRWKELIVGGHAISYGNWRKLSHFRWF